MTTDNPLSTEKNLPSNTSTACTQEAQEDLYGTFLDMRDLLEDYAPCWYSENLRERVEAVVSRTGR
jgi:hypothetical protein